MSNDAILPLDDDDVNQIPEEIVEEEKYLLIGNALREIANTGKQACARYNLGLGNVLNEIDNLIGEEGIIAGIESRIDALSCHVDTNKSDVDKTLGSLETVCVKTDGTTPFKGVQEGVTPISSPSPKALTTVEFVNDALSNRDTDINKKINEVVEDISLTYALSDDVYSKNNTYSKNEVKNLLEQYVKSDGSVTFKKPVSGETPKYRSHLSTKGYVDDAIRNHKNETDPHNFKTILNNKLSNYYQKSETYTKAQTYSRLQLDSIIDKLVSDACKGLVDRHVNNVQHLSSQEVIQMIRQYASSNLISNEDLEEALVGVDYQLKKVNPIWKTSGPVLTTVGFVEDNTELPAEMTMQEILDAIFYGAKISMELPDKVQIGQTVDITLCVHGGTTTERIILYQGDEILQEFTDEDFADGCITIESNPISKDTEFKFVVDYYNGMQQTVNKTVYIAYPMFVGLLPKWKFGNTITWEDLEEFASDDAQNNKFVIDVDGLNKIVINYNFTDSQLKHPFVVVPATYPDLVNMTTASQRFGKDAFDTIDLIPMKVPNAGENGIVFKMYIYKQALSSLNQEVTFNFNQQ